MFEIGSSQCLNLRHIKLHRRNKGINKIKKTNKNNMHLLIEIINTSSPGFNHQSSSGVPPLSTRTV
jgi:hypothetical protein